ncbi:hypothetical protein K438DRAFT_1967822 [Mycena galopus ATCC 62051]|nr:hypothetical protein K438DRAFT_1967822 [Mycena galopus ATCC 62051]
MVSIPDSDNKDGEISKAGATVDAGTEWEAAPRAMILGTEVTIPMVDLVITQVLKFTVPGTFALEGMTAWLASATEQCGGYWTRMVREESQPRAYYYVEFDSSDAALRIKGLVNVRDGTVRLVDFGSLRDEALDLIAQSRRRTGDAPSVAAARLRLEGIIGAALLIPDVVRGASVARGVSPLFLVDGSEVGPLRGHNEDRLVVVVGHDESVAPLAPATEWGAAIDPWLHLHRRGYWERRSQHRLPWK